MARIQHQTIALLLMIAGFVGITGATFGQAHAPSDISISYDLTKQELTVNITHSVSNPSTHYINEVEIKKNNMVVNTSTYTSQPTTAIFSYIYQINATAGDNFSVTAKCNQGGSNIDSITVHGITQPTTDSNSNSSSESVTKGEISGFEHIIPFLLGSISLGIIYIRKRMNTR
jgi:hypothetical protein